MAGIPMVIINLFSLLLHFLF